MKIKHSNSNSKETKSKKDASHRVRKCHIEISLTNVLHSCSNNYKPIRVERAQRPNHNNVEWNCKFDAFSSSEKIV